jgi:hypothetical protein
VVVTSGSNSSGGKAIQSSWNSFRSFICK